MTLEFALRATEIILALAFLQQSLEHFVGAGDERRLFFAEGNIQHFVIGRVLQPMGPTGLISAQSVHSTSFCRAL